MKILKDITINNFNKTVKKSNKGCISADANARIKLNANVIISDVRKR